MPSTVLLYTRVLLFSYERELSMLIIQQSCRLCTRSARMTLRITRNITPPSENRTNHVSAIPALNEQGKNAIPVRCQGACAKSRRFLEILQNILISKLSLFYMHFPCQNTGTYSLKKPVNPRKLKVSSTAGRPSQHEKFSGTDRTPVPSRACSLRRTAPPHRAQALPGRTKRTRP